MDERTDISQNRVEEFLNDQENLTMIEDSEDETLLNVEQIRESLKLCLEQGLDHLNEEMDHHQLQIIATKIEPLKQYLEIVNRYRRRRTLPRTWSDSTNDSLYLN